MERTADQGRGRAAWQFALLAALLVAALPLVVSLADPRPWKTALLLPPLLLALVAVLATRAMIAGYPHDRLGACNVVTLLRAALTAGIFAALMSPGALAWPFVRWAVVGIAVVALILDGVDGWLARREGLVSDFGARFDMEVDALLALVLAFVAVQTGNFGPWVLVLGGLRYAYVAAGVLLPWLQGQLPPRFGRKAVCVIQIATLIALVAPPVVPPLSFWLAGIATALLLWSFGRDILWLWHRR